MSADGALSLAVDYSQEELRALAAAFGGADVFAAVGAAAAAPLGEAVEAAALRGLIARRAVAAGPDGALALLEPHATLLPAVLWPDGAVRAGGRSFFVRGERAVELAPLPLGIVRATLLAPDVLRERALAAVPGAPGAWLRRAGDELAGETWAAGDDPSEGVRRALSG